MGVKGVFLKGMPSTHRNCLNVDWVRPRDYACKVNGKTFLDLDEKCQFEVEIEITKKIKAHSGTDIDVVEGDHSSKECCGRGLIDKKE